MAHFAELDETNKVLQVIVIANEDCMENGKESETKGSEFCSSLLGGRWVQTSFNARIRKNYAAINYTYDPTRDAFIPPKPYPSWLLEENTCRWYSPSPRPTDGKAYNWNEETLSWTHLEEPQNGYF